MRRCKHCKTELPPAAKCTDPHKRAGHCNAECAYEAYKAKQAQKAEREYKDRTNELKRDMLANDRSHWMKKAQIAFNAYIRARDAGKPCISSGRPLAGKFDAGHYRSVGAHPELRFCELNCHGQSVADNQHKSGNLVEYRINLISRIGLDAVEWLEGPHDPKKYTIDDLKEIEKEYREKLKKLAQ